MSRLFISHSSLNNAAAIALYNWFREQGWDDVFLDLDPMRGIAAGERWERALSQAANRCEAVVFLVSRAWLQSDWCRRELHLAVKLNKRLFGVTIEDLPIKDIPPDLTAQWQVVNLSKGSDHEMFKAGLSDGSEAHVTFSKDGLRRLRAGLEKAGIDARFFPWPPPDDSNRPPYSGLRPLDVGDAGIFFGREADTILVLDRLRGLASSFAPRFLAILGASGAGKSSFLRAGLWPRLQRDDRNFLPLPILRPGRGIISGETGLVECLKTAFAARNSALSRAAVAESVNSGLSGTEHLLLRLAQLATVPGVDGEPGKPPTLVLFLDQAEELFSAESAPETSHFLTLIRALLASPAVKLICVAAIRSDFYERLQTVSELKGIFQETFSLTPISEGAYGQIIEAPAARLADTSRPLALEPQLIQKLLRDIGRDDAKDALPLLAFTLERLYREEGATGKLTLKGYESIGGIAGSINAAVEDALRAAEAMQGVPRGRTERLALIRMGSVPWLARIDPETGAPARRVARQAEIPAEAREIMTCLVNARLLSADRDDATGETTIEPAHEALLRNWGELKRWLDQDADALALFEGVKRAASDWDAQGRAEGWLLHRGSRLEEVERYVAANTFPGFLRENDRAYLAASREAENQAARREKTRRRAIYAASAAAFLMLFGVAGFYLSLQSMTTLTLTLLQTAGNTADDYLDEDAQRRSGIDRFIIKRLRRRAKEKIDEVNAEGEQFGAKEKLVDVYINKFMTENQLMTGIQGQLKPAGKSVGRISNYVTKEIIKAGYLDKTKKIVRSFMIANYTTAQIRALLSFQQSPLGRDALTKLQEMNQEAMPKIFMESMQLGQQIGQQLNENVNRVPGFESFEQEIRDAFLKKNFDLVSNRAIEFASAVGKNETRILGETGIFTAEALTRASLLMLLGRNYEAALSAADRALAIDSDNLSASLRRAHALLFLGRVQEAKSLYLGHKGQLVLVGLEQKRWDDLVAEDFSNFYQLGLPTTYFHEVISLLSPSQMPAFPASQASGQAPSITQPSVATNLPAGTSQSAGQQMAFSANFDIFKNYDLEVQSNEVLQVLALNERKLCEEACGNDQRCIAYSFNKFDRKCYTKRTTGTLLRFDARTISGIRKGNAMPSRRSSDTELATWIRNGQTFPNSGPTRFNLSREDCQKWCESKPREECAAFASFRDRGECRILSDPDAYTDHANADIGYRLQPPR